MTDLAGCLAVAGSLALGRVRIISGQAQRHQHETGRGGRVDRQQHGQRMGDQVAAEGQADGAADVEGGLEYRVRLQPSLRWRVTADQGGRGRDEGAVAQGGHAGDADGDRVGTGRDQAGGECRGRDGGHRDDRPAPEPGCHHAAEPGSRHGADPGDDESRPDFPGGDAPVGEDEREEARKETACPVDEHASRQHPDRGRDVTVIPDATQGDPGHWRP